MLPSQGAPAQEDAVAQAPEPRKGVRSDVALEDAAKAGETRQPSVEETQRGKA